MAIGIIYTKEPIKAHRTQRRYQEQKEPEKEQKPEGSNVSDQIFNEYQDEEEIKLEEIDRT